MCACMYICMYVYIKVKQAYPAKLPGILNTVHLQLMHFGIYFTQYIIDLKLR